MNIHPSIRARPLPALAGIVVVAGLAWWSFTASAVGKDVAEPPPILVHDGKRIVIPEQSPLRQSLAIAALSEEDLEVPFALPAVVEADPARLFKALPPVVGRITRIDKHLGDRVAVGDILFELDSPDLAQATSDAQKARAALALARAALQRQRALGASEIAAQRDIEQAENDYEQAASEVARADARLAQLGARGKAGDGRVLTVRSPLAGVVVEENATVGTFWNDLTAPLLSVTDLSTVLVTANADERDLGNVFVGQAAEVRLDAYPGETLAGKVRSVGQVLDADTRRVKLRLVFANRDGRLKPGMFASTSLRGKPHRGLIVPIAAVVQSGFDSRVFVEVAPWTFEPRVVQLGPRLGGRIEIVKGLSAGERVVVTNGVLIND